MAQSLIETPIGPLFIVTSERGVRLLTFAEGYRHDGLVKALRPGSAGEVAAAEAMMAETARQLEDYFDGERLTFDLPLDLEGTEFQKRVWQAIADIPFGHTASYSEVALSAGAPNAYRAAGTACGANPIVILIPCHRVIGTDKGLHGFGGGLDTKVWLLSHEGIQGVKADGWANSRAYQRQAVLI
ncbi:MAG: methylated-DNA--[protein]-cysteine S-methyltransferase [Dehalococcoidia bacterium]|nr:methylated-DNA--[protein]-cysteine S-methyltransferase [Dehalococcoidia bacterium]